MHSAYTDLTGAHMCAHAHVHVHTAHTAPSACHVPSIRSTHTQHTHAHTLTLTRSRSHTHASAHSSVAKQRTAQSITAGDHVPLRSHTLPGWVADMQTGAHYTHAATLPGWVADMQTGPVASEMRPSHSAASPRVRGRVKRSWISPEASTLPSIASST